MRSGRSAQICASVRSKEAGALARQPVDQVDVDRIEAQPARRRHQVEHLPGRLDPVHRLLHGGVEILDAEAQAVEAQSRPGVARRSRVDGARVDLDRILAVRRQREGAAQHGHQRPQARRRPGRSACRRPGAAGAPPRRGRAAPPAGRPRAPGSAGTRARLLVVPGDDLVAGAVVAQRFAERDVHVERQRQRAGAGAVPRCCERLRVVVAP